jgi:hypothetical protein
MADTSAATPKKTTTKAKKPKVKPTHPPTSQMVQAAIKSLKERGGSSSQAIKKYIAANYKVDVEKLSPFIRKYLKNAVASGQLIQTKGKGASGSFKLSSSKTAGEKKPAKKGKTGAKKVKKAPAAKKPKKTGEKKKKATPKKPKAAKSPKKEKKAKAPKKPSKPKPKKAAPKSAKKATPKKK